MKHVEFVNSLILSQISKVNNIVLFGQNINAGSCLGGLCRGLKIKDPGKIINTPNSENTLVGIGFGLMLNSVSSIFFMKQQDFLLLGIDHLVNTYNIIRVSKPRASFTIMPVIVDSGYEGPQSALNNFSDFCSIANIDGYSFTNKEDAETIIRRHLVAPGFRIIGVSQRLLKQDLLELEVIEKDKRGRFFKYFEGENISIICFNYSLPYGLELFRALKDKNLSSSLFSINTYSEFDFNSIIKDVSKTRKIVLIDDSKSGNQLCDRFLTKVYESCQLDKVIILRRKMENTWFYPNIDELKIDYQSVTQQLCS